MWEVAIRVQLRLLVMITAMLERKRGLYTFCLNRSIGLSLSLRGWGILHGTCRVGNMLSSWFSLFFWLVLQRFINWYVRCINRTVPITIGSVEEYIHLIVFPGLLIDSSLFCGQDGIKGARHRIRV